MLSGVHAIAQNSPAPDNTKVNKSDRAAGALAADQAKNNKSDREVMKEIRKSIVDDKSLSSYAHNVKVIAQNGQVTLKGPVHSEEERFAEQMRFAEYMNTFWEERAKKPKSFDVISIMAHGEATSKMTLRQRMGILILFLVGGNDTTRNSMSGGLLGLSRHPAEWQKLREHPELLPSAISEFVRWQTPVIHMRRTALEDAEIGGKPIKAGDKVVIWYISGNRDEEMIERPDEVIVDRKRPREHMSFGFGIHRCLGNRLAELQLRILWEEILRRDLRIEVVDKPVYAYSNFLHAIRQLPVRIEG